MMEIYCSDSAATEALGQLLGSLAADGDVYCLTGGLGAGKTLLSRGIAAGLGADVAEVNSPHLCHYECVRRQAGNAPF